MRQGEQTQNYYIIMLLCYLVLYACKPYRHVYRMINKRIYIGSFATDLSAYVTGEHHVGRTSVLQKRSEGGGGADALGDVAGGEPMVLNSRVVHVF